MASVRTLHEIVTSDRLYPAGQVVDDMPQSLIDEMRPLGAIEIIEPETEAAPVAGAKTGKKGA